MTLEHLDHKFFDTISSPFIVPLTAIFSWIWIPPLKDVSEDCALWLPILGVVLLVAQTILRIFLDVRSHRKEQ